MFTRLLIFVSIAAMLLSCSGKEEQKLEFDEVRIHRWTALEGGETFVLRHIGTNWSAKLQGDNDRFSCSYQRDVKPKSDWNSFWNSLMSDGLMDLSGKEQSLDINDGDGFDVEVLVNGKFNQYSVAHPAHQKSENAKRILKIGDLIANEFNTPVFVSNYDRGQVGEYLINICRNLRN